MAKTFLTSLCCLIYLVSAHSWSKPTILTSIKPLALIVQDLVGDQFQVTALLSANADPHHYALTVSERRALGDADVVVRLGPEFERFLSKPLANIASERSIDLSEFLGQKSGSENSSDPLKQSDLHPWLDPNQAIVISESVARRLVDQTPSLRDPLYKRLIEQRRQYQQLDKNMSERLKSFQHKNFIADHPAYLALANAYGLHSLAAVQTHDDIAPGAGQLKEITEIIEREAPSCLLARKGNTSSALQRWAKQWQLKIVEVDLLGASPEIQTYADLMASVSGAMETCFNSD